MKSTIIAATMFAALTAIAAANPSYAATTCAGRMKQIKTEMKNAAGPDVDLYDAQTHYRAASKAMRENHDQICLHELNAASMAIADAKDLATEVTRDVTQN